MAMLWIKAFHIVFVTSWFAGLFYLPRLFVNLALETDATSRARLLLMSKKLLRFTTLLAVAALTTGLGLWLGYGIGLSGPGNGWMHVKLALVALVIVYHAICARLLGRIAAGSDAHTHRWYRWFNEVPVLLLIGIVAMVVVKPF
jgi:putative membrane protein